jgi:hypothetical protein
VRTKIVARLVPIFFIGPFMACGNHASAQPCEVAGEFRQALPKDRLNINFHCDALGREPDAIYVQATLQHEIIHALKAQGIIDDDVPIAAAMGYYTEWIQRGSLLDNTKIPLFKQGLTAPVSEIDEMILKYRRRSEREPLESYEDGAKLAGMIFKRFGNDDKKVRIYVLALGMGLDQQLATRAVASREFSKVIFSLRLGEYFLFDEAKLAHDLSTLEPATKSDVERYIKSVNERFKIGLVPKKDVKDVVVGGFPK